MEVLAIKWNQQVEAVFLPFILFKEIEFIKL